MTSIRQKREKEIIEAAKKVFIEKGYTSATMEDIIDKTNLSKGGVYHYFNSKSDICIQLMDSVSSSRLDLTNKLKRDDKDTILDSLCDYFLNILKADSEEVKLTCVIIIDTRNDFEFQEKIHRRFVGRDLTAISQYVYSKVTVVNKELFERKLKYFLEIFHAILYYKYIENVNYFEIEYDIKEMFKNIFKDVILE